MLPVPAALRRPFVVVVLVTLLLTGVRLAGERLGGPGWLFGRSAGGGGSLLGIGWLIPIIGFWFGRVLAREAPPPNGRGRALLLVVAGLAGVASVFTVARLMLPITFGTFLFAATSLPLLTGFAWRAWPALARALLLYALGARLPILVITVLAVAGNWGTHYEQLAPGSSEMSDVARALVLCVAQLCLWIPLTVQIGCLSGLVAPRRRDPHEWN